jgi:hypothetical protein
MLEAKSVANGGKILIEEGRIEVLAPVDPLLARLDSPAT